MHQEIKKYPVRDKILQKYIKFFWEIRIEYMQLNHGLIPQRNINLRFNLSETPQYIHSNGTDSRLENVYFQGLHTGYREASLKAEGNIDMLGVCFSPESFFPFFKIPVCEFRNRMLGADEIGFKSANNLIEQMKDAHNIAARLDILENKLISLLDHDKQIPASFPIIFNAVKQSNESQLYDFCKQNNIGMRKLERMFNKYVGIPASTYGTLNRFHSSLNQLLYKNYSKLSDLAFDNGYFDQMHFIREFKRFAGDTPKNFIHRNNSILQVGKLT